MGTSVFVSKRDKKDGGKWCVSPVINGKDPDDVDDYDEFDSEEEAVNRAIDIVSRDPDGGLLSVEDKKTGEIHSTRFLPK